MTKQLRYDEEAGEFIWKDEPEPMDAQQWVDEVSAEAARQQWAADNERRLRIADDASRS